MFWCACTWARAVPRSAFICVDFPNKRGPDSQHPEPSFYYDLLARDGLEVFREISYGKLRLEVELFLQGRSLVEQHNVHPDAHGGVVAAVGDKQREKGYRPRVRAPSGGRAVQMRPAAGLL